MSRLSCRTRMSRIGAVAVAAGIALSTVVLTSDPADAARRRRLRPRPELVAMAAQDPFAAIRHCESRGNYQAVSRNRRYYGAYQFDVRTWRGLGYQGMPHEAAPEIQDEAARRLQEGRGWQPWPTCSRLAGLR